MGWALGVACPRGMWEPGAGWRGVTGGSGWAGYEVMPQPQPEIQNPSSITSDQCPVGTCARCGQPAWGWAIGRWAWGFGHATHTRHTQHIRRTTYRTTVPRARRARHRHDNRQIG